MKKADQIEVELYAHSLGQSGATADLGLNQTIVDALDGIKSFSPGEVFEYLQSRFPIYELKSKSHAKAASSMLTRLSGLVDSDELDRSELAQLKLYMKALNQCLEIFEASLVSEAQMEETSIPQKRGLADSLLQNLRNAVEAEKRNFFGVEKAREKGVIDAEFKKIKNKKSR
jgi:hypothetical protein